MGFPKEEEYQKKTFYSLFKSLTKLEIFKVFLSAFVGTTITIIASALVNVTLLEVSMSLFFAFYFGICFMVIGIAISIQAYNISEENEKAAKKKPFLYLFSVLVFISGLFCIFLEENWVQKLHYIEKIPFYMMVAISLNFCIIFCIIDILNFILGFFQESWQKSIVETQKQIVTILVISIFLGMYYGFCFGIFDIEGEVGIKRDFKLIQEQSFCLPVACAFGFFGGALNEILRIKGNFRILKFKKIDYKGVQDEEDYLVQDEDNEEDPFGDEIESQNQSYISVNQEQDSTL
ncbi:hypothetical protein PPERSA_11666 [Pseudocohnilembus persalinus]|uniref:Transmembrane protein n=1 Tax=Pseudocohnilembus persalinus TaxID=266149 RepID=A0A0V0QA09_PSEPJ|nr:hypothetical protein PPERSA_11666 [Pseudocohnilembus persalinus]|eukprot:KRW99065.1 hypothetical protein PPERSA_11666 [Pseudocohnilembus persalinus]